jgi:hypothetical protein
MSFSFVYLIWAVGTDIYKIGKSRKPGRRLETIQQYSPLPLEIVHLIPADQAHKLEATLHEHYSHKRLHGEWFELTLDEVIFIESIRNVDEVTSLKQMMLFDTNHTIHL